MMPNQRKSTFSSYHSGNRPLGNDNGSMIVIVLMVLVIMTAIGIVSTNMVVTESLIIRNAAIHRQNVNLLESALMRGLQDFMQINNNSAIDFFDPDRLANDWINPNTGPFDNAPGAPGWYELNYSGRVLNANNSVDFNLPNLLAQRGESVSGNLRYALVGWTIPFGGGMKGGQGQAQMREGRCVAEYVSLDAAGNDNGFGLLRMEIGIRRQWL